MTKIEYEKCEKMMREAISLAEQSKMLWDRSEEYFKKGDKVEGEIQQRRSDQYYGEAIGICKILSELHFQHDDMDNLIKLTW